VPNLHLLQDPVAGQGDLPDLEGWVVDDLPKDSCEIIHHFPDGFFAEQLGVVGPLEFQRTTFTGYIQKYLEGLKFTRINCLSMRQPIDVDTALQSHINGQHKRY